LPAFDGVVSDADIIAALSYIKSRWPEDVRRRHNELDRVFEMRRSAADIN
jgi:hypothetical protein